jgi:DNA modification methylase
MDNQLNAKLELDYVRELIRRELNGVVKAQVMTEVGKVLHDVRKIYNNHLSYFTTPLDNAIKDINDSLKDIHRDLEDLLAPSDSNKSAHSLLRDITSRHNDMRDKLIRLEKVIEEATPLMDKVDELLSREQELV